MLANHRPGLSWHMVQLAIPPLCTKEKRGTSHRHCSSRSHRVPPLPSYSTTGPRSDLSRYLPAYLASPSPRLPVYRFPPSQPSPVRNKTSRSPLQSNSLGDRRYNARQLFQRRPVPAGPLQASSTFAGRAGLSARRVSPLSCFKPCYPALTRGTIGIRKS